MDEYTKTLMLRQLSFNSSLPRVYNSNIRPLTPNTIQAELYKIISDLNIIVKSTNISQEEKKQKTQLY
jgi:rRNA-processing protein FCF1